MNSQELSPRTPEEIASHRSGGARPSWLVMLEGSRQRWGGDLRRAQIFRRLAEMTDATVVEGWSLMPLREEFGLLRLLPTPLTLLHRGARPRLATSEMMRPDILRMARRVVDPAAVAVYDDPVAQARDLGIVLPPDREAYFRARKRANLAAFRWHVVPTASFAEHIGLDMSRVIVAGNGTDTEHIIPGEWPEEPAIGMVSGAAPGRGIEALIAAARLLHADIPDLRLLLWLAATGDASEAYLRQLEREVRAERWIEISTAAYEDLRHVLRQATVLTIPHPPGDYYDVALPVKLLDSMAAGRPLAVTPRLEGRAIVERHRAGLVAGGDSVDDLADAIRRLIEDEALARELGANARRAAVDVYDWNAVGERLATAILEREG